MKFKNKSRLTFLIDQDLFLEGKSHLIEEVLKNYKAKIVFQESEINEKAMAIIFTTYKKIKKYSHVKNKIVICDELDFQDISTVLKCDYMSYEHLESIIEQILDAERKTALSNILKESEKNFDGIKTLNESKTDLDKRNIIKDVEAVLDLEISLLKVEKLNDWNLVFKNFVKKINWLTQLEVLHFEEVINSELIFEENIFVFKLPFEDYFLFCKFKNHDLVSHSYQIEILINTLLKSMQLFDLNLIRTDDEIDFWKRIFAKIPYPMAVITKLGDLLVYNELFAKIGILPKECLSYKEQETIEVDQQFYIVKKIEIELSGQIVFYFVFYTSDKNSLSGTDKNSNVDELGIVSSSIAHELNNPLAGILAALTLISLEDDWSDDSLSEIEDMKNGARRCKELVEIFLGFSRFSPNQNYQTSVKDSVNQAINLLRFRMVESNLRIEMKYTATLESFSPNINSSILSMILYLIISDLLTSFAHHRLVSNSTLSHLSGEILELSNQIIIRLDEDFEYEDKLVQSKLIQHLLMFEKMDINFLKKEIRLISKINYQNNA